MGPKNGMGVVVKRKFAYLCRESNLGHPASNQLF